MSSFSRVIRCIGCLAVALAIVVAGSVSQGGMLNLVPTGAYVADVTTFFTTATYNAVTDQLNIAGTPVAIDYDQTAPPDATVNSGGPGQLASFAINVLVNSAGVLLGPATATDLVIMGAIPGGPHPTPAYAPILTGQVLFFGFEDAPPHRMLEFVFLVTGGSQQAQFGPLVGVVFDSINGFGGSFNINFDTAITGNADTFAVPEPGSAVLALLGAGGIALVARRKRRGC